MTGLQDFQGIKKDTSGGSELFNKRIGIIGFGEIGQNVANIAIGIGMKVVVHDYKNRTHTIRWKLSQSYANMKPIELEFVSSPLDSLLANSDVVTVHTPGTAEVIGAKELALLQRTAILINTARGGVVNEQYLLQALDNNLLAGAGIDVYCNEPPIDMRLLSHPKCSVTAHIGAGTVEARRRVEEDIIDRICSRFVHP